LLDSTPEIILLALQKKGLWCLQVVDNFSLWNVSQVKSVYWFMFF